MILKKHINLDNLIFIHFNKILKKKNSDWVSTCRELQVEGARNKGRDRKTLNKYTKVDIKWLDLVKDDAHIQDKWSIQAHPLIFKN